jgi:hypothetical protein
VVLVGASSLGSYSYYPYLGNSTLEPNIAQTITLGTYVAGSANNATFVFSNRAAGQPSVVVTSSGTVVYANKLLSTGMPRLTGTVPDVVIQLGNWYIGDYNSTLTINPTTGSGAPSMAMDTLGNLYTASAVVNGPAPASLLLNATSSSVIQLGNYLMGPSPSNSSYL